ncbi:ACBP-domain-containing protein [Atractiella rhizophila]|nr:ACBP-domain-containing protein [Atractiella rhizophila]
MSDAKFTTACKIIQGLPKNGPVQPSQDDQLRFYGFYKQATEGDVNTSRPGVLDFVGKAKWDAWNSHKGMSKEEAKAEYVNTFLEFHKRFPDNEEAVAHIAQVEAA